MSAFIHGELNWRQRPEAVRANVQSMVDAVQDYPWASTRIEELSLAPTSCAIAAQHSIASPGHGEGSSGLGIAADLALHRRHQLLADLEIPEDESDAISDEALIARAYRKWGLRSAERILGEGVFALWDQQAQRLICWRDAAGVRPLYYNHVPGSRFLFSSDLQSLIAHPALTAKFDLEYARAFLANEQFQHPTRTLVEGVFKIPPAHIVVVDRDGLQIRRYWDPSRVEETRTATDLESAEELLSLLRLAIDDRVTPNSDVVGAHLSGGLDSTSVALIAAGLLQAKDHELPAFSWAPPREVVPAMERDERDLVDAAARFAEIRPRYTRLTAADVVEVAYRDVALRPRATLNFEVATSGNAAKEGVRKILSGWGGDEMIALNGRGYFADLARRGRLLTVSRELKQRSEIQGGSLRGAWKSRVAMPFLPDWALRSGNQPPPPLPAELRPEFAQVLASVEPLTHQFPRERPGLHRMQIALLEFGHLQYRMESWAAHGASLGISYTFPLLDRRIMEFSLRLPGRMFFRNGWKRWLYRTAMEGIVPDSVRWNPTKYDDAAGHHLRSVLMEPSDKYREPLLERRDNQLVDIDMLVAEQDRQKGLRSLSGDAHEYNDSRPSSVGSGAWLAFTRVRP
ncbi:MAG TPA: asparagine synthase-related protein [Acidimicrobiia bacterium]|nr:asparagine synthase-related protein [Acidimicrobiia bacterium]